MIWLVREVISNLKVSLRRKDNILEVAMRSKENICPTSRSPNSFWGDTDFRVEPDFSENKERFPFFEGSCYMVP